MLTKLVDYGSLSPSNFSLSPDQFSVELSQAILQAKTWLSRSVPLTTLNDAKLALESNTATPDQIALRNAEYFYTLWWMHNLAAARSTQANSVRMGSISVQHSGQDERHKLAGKLFAKARYFLRLAGFEEEGDNFAGVRGGDPLSP